MNDIDDIHRYHLGFIIGPKNEAGDRVPGARYYVKNNFLKQWIYEEIPLNDVKQSTQLLARIMVAKIEDEARLVRIFETVPIMQNNPDWRCRTWVANAMAAIPQDGRVVGTSQLSWEEIERVGREFVGTKSQAGRYNDQASWNGPRPTLDLIQRREVIG
ncbi:hypothetical protein GLAREA_06719 [Glarea lozoyensis ATCC 20868]|nr:uncharacterized protein GLAREA_06719 [Glarea lozoyensis ATCC 20868]EPE33706.1 hypothetical protein GLAREA_06719 [Glarea lozoyensis ATCC 20868]